MRKAGTWSKQARQEHSQRMKALWADRQKEKFAAQLTVVPRRKYRRHRRERPDLVTSVLQELRQERERVTGAIKVLEKLAA